MVDDAWWYMMDNDVLTKNHKPQHVLFSRDNRTVEWWLRVGLSAGGLSDQVYPLFR